MKLREIVELAAIMLQLDEVLEHDALKNGGEFVADGSNASITVNQLIRCADLVIKQTAAEYVPLQFSEQIEVEQRELEYSRLAKPVVDILRVEKNGVKVGYKIMPSYVLLNEIGSLSFLYTYEPRRCGLNDDIDYASSRIPARVFAYGVAAEWALISAMYDEAAIWDKRFKESLLNLASSNAPKRVKQRRWL